MPAIVTAVSRSASHTFGKPNEPMIRLVSGLGVEGDAHMGEKVKHRYHVLKKDRSSIPRVGRHDRAGVFHALLHHRPFTVVGRR
jgi:hypothetical protein